MEARNLFHQFTSSTVHDLREPVRSIKLFCELLVERLSGQIDADSQRHLEYLRLGSIQLHQVLNGMGEFSVALGSPHWVGPVELELTARGAAQELDSECKAGGVQIHIQSLPTVLGDFDALQMLFRHVLQNSIRYRGDAPLKIHICAVESGEECEDPSLAYTFEVKDNGAGIPADFLPRIFEPYSRGYGRELAGNGLGLAICQRIVENHGGTIWARSDPGEGTSLYFTLPKDGPPAR